MGEISNATLDNDRSHPYDGAERSSTDDSPSLGNYPKGIGTKDKLVGDLSAGIVVAVMLIPQVCAVCVVATASSLVSGPCVR